MNFQSSNKRDVEVLNFTFFGFWMGESWCYIYVFVYTYTGVQHDFNVYVV